MAVGECLQEWGSLVLRPHPAHVKWRELVSQVQIFGLAPEVRIEIMQKREQVCTTQSNAMKFIIQYWPTCILYTLTITRLLYFCKPKDLDLWHQSPSLWPGMMSLSKGFDSVGLAWAAFLWSLIPERAYSSHVPTKWTWVVHSQALPSVPAVICAALQVTESWAGPPCTNSNGYLCWSIEAQWGTKRVC